MIAYLLATLGAGLVVAFYVLSQNGVDPGGPGFVAASWLAWLFVSVLAAPLAIILLGVPEIFEIRPNYILWTIIGAVIGLISQFFWMATPLGAAVASGSEVLPDYPLFSEQAYWGVLASAGAVGGFVLAALRRSILR